MEAAVAPDAPSEKPARELLSESEYYCPECHVAVRRPLVCKSCLSAICRDCGTPLERPDELGIG
jgi:hypothetical protein